MTIPPFKLTPEPLIEEARALPGFQWAGENIGKRHQLGGSPSVKVDPWPVCVNCKERMIFYGQLDSINDEYCIADVGLILVFLCFECFESTSMVASA